jgi:drug/metabolite transporter (DMT)-like permease
VTSGTGDQGTGKRGLGGTATPRGGAGEAALGLLLGLVGVAVFSLTLPVTRLAVLEIDPAFVAFGRMALAGLAAGATLLLARAPLPARRDLPALLVVAAASCSASRSSARSPCARSTPRTAPSCWPCCRSRPRPPGPSSPASALRTLLARRRRRRRGRRGLRPAPQPRPAEVADLYLLLACALAAAGYAAGGALARRMPGLHVIAWALVLSLPLSAALAATRLPALAPTPARRRGSRSSTSP